MKTKSKKQQGFTLLELAIAMTLLGILTMIIAPNFTSLAGVQSRQADLAAKAENQALRETVEDWVRNQSSDGLLPLPATVSGRSFVLCDPSSTATGNLCEFIRNRKGTLQGVFNDEKAAKNLKVFQSVNTLQQTVPLFLQSGPILRVDYSVGTIYSTKCSDTTGGNCIGDANNPPGDSALLTSANYANWAASGADFGAIVFSTLPVQLERAKALSEQISSVRTAFQKYFDSAYSLVLSQCSTTTSGGGISLLGLIGLGSTTSTTTCSTSDLKNLNLYPTATGTGAPVLSGRTPSSNQGCRDGWYDLGASNVNILDVIGLDKAQFGRTPWAGQIQYCRDYDVTGGNGANTFPHYAALRVHTRVAKEKVPSATDFTQNLVISF